MLTSRSPVAQFCIDYSTVSRTPIFLYQLHTKVADFKKTRPNNDDFVENLYQSQFLANVLRYFLS